MRTSGSDASEFPSHGAHALRDASIDSIIEVHHPPAASSLSEAANEIAIHRDENEIDD